MNKKNKNKIAWVTPDYFVDCDIDLMPGLLGFFDIHWIVLLPIKSRFHESDFEKIRKQNDNLTMEFVYDKGRQRNPMNILANYKLVMMIKQVKPDVVYLNMSINPWNLIMIPFLKSNMTIVTAHQGKVHAGMAHKKIITAIRNLWYGHFKNVNMFSRSQAELFMQDFTSSKVFQFVLGLKDFGRATNERPNNGVVRFLSFGTLNYSKSIETLIDATCLLYERGVRGFKVSIIGSCKDWSWYQQRIKYPELFELDNSEIPNFFNRAHYLVQPYRVVSQSGPTKIAYNYNLPVIVSNLPGFMDELEENVNGYSFECGNAESLADRMQKLIESHTIEYYQLLERMKKYTEEHYSEAALVGSYKMMFEEIIASIHM